MAFNRNTILFIVLLTTLVAVVYTAGDNVFKIGDINSKNSIKLNTQTVKARTYTWSKKHSNITFISVNSTSSRDNCTNATILQGGLKNSNVKLEFGTKFKNSSVSCYVEIRGTQGSSAINVFTSPLALFAVIFVNFYIFTSNST